MFGSSHLRPKQNTTTAGQTRPSQNRRSVASTGQPGTDGGRAKAAVRRSRHHAGPGNMSCVGPCADRQVRRAVVVQARLLLVALALVTVSLSTLSRTAAAKTVSPGTFVLAALHGGRRLGTQHRGSRQNADAALAGVTSLDAAKKVLMTAERRLLADTDQAVKALQRAGAPRVPNGKKVASRGLAGMTLVRQAFERQVREAGRGSNR